MSSTHSIIEHHVSVTEGMGEEISDGDFTTLILASPKSYHPLINMILLPNHVSTKPLKPRTVIELILEELD